MFPFLKRKIKSLASNFGYRIVRTDNHQYFNFQALIHYYLSRHNSIEFVQIGGCDGINWDPLYPVIKSRPDAFRGIIVEPIEDYYNELKALYKDNSQIRPLCYAIHNSLDEAILYKINPDVLQTLPDYAKGAVSFERTHIGKYDLPVDNIVEEKVPCKRLEELMDEENIKDPDLLLIDTEGYDAEILLNNNFDKNRPPIIHFEHGLRDNLTSSEQLDKIFQKLHSNQYELIFQDYDAVAIHRKLLLSITE